MPEIRKLSNISINRIAAGEVVEKPSSVVKELCENSIDSGAKNISIALEMGGKNLISIKDDGCGMDRNEILLALERHTTSKLRDEDLTNIEYFGFRGEAIPSISSISNMIITSRTRQMDKAYKIESSGGEIIKEYYIDADYGTKIEVKELFFSTPARLKFLKTDKAEIKASVDIIKRMSLAHLDISFQLISDNKIIFSCSENDNYESRIAEVLGKEFIENSSKIILERENYNFRGYTSIPTFNKASSLDQFLFINKRPVKDKLLNIALKVAYQDYLTRDRHPASVIFIDANPRFVDVNVHPAKTEVRFREPNEVRSMLIGAIKDSLSTKSHSTSTALSSNFVEKIIKSNMADDASKFSNFSNKKPQYNVPTDFSRSFPKEDKPSKAKIFSTPSKNLFETINLESRNFEKDVTHEFKSNRLGSAIAQIHDTYILSTTEDGFIITDQHASHERLVYEKLKKDLLQTDLPTQRLLVPEIVELDSEFSLDIFLAKQELLKKLGLVFQKFNDKSVIVNEVPSLLGDFDVKKLILDLSENFKDIGEDIALSELIEHVTETYACHHSIRSGRKMSINEMNQLLREMENTPFSGQCNHGRPTYVKLQKEEIEKLFSRR